ncbi:MAG: hypothetical protein ACHQIM_11545 [Sphingobacteriales bacterium]
MNIALSAVVISILLIPPVAFYLSLYTGNFPKPTPKFSLFEGILASAVISLFIHAAAISFIPNEIRFDILIKVLGGDLKNLENIVRNQEFKKAIKDFALYNAVLILVMFLSGRGLRLILQFHDLHASNELFNLYNKWWYFFNGFHADIEDFDLVFIDAVMDTGDGTMIYSGFLVHFETKDGQLDRIYLQDTVRREFKSHAGAKGTHLINKAGEPVQIPGNTFSLKYENVINLNINFILLDKENTVEETPVRVI